MEGSVIVLKSARAMLQGMLRIALAAWLCAGAVFARAGDAPWGKKDFGVLLAGPGGGSDWDQLIGELRKTLGKTRPVQAVAGAYGTRELQRAIESLQAEQVKKIVVVPLYLHSESRDTEQLRYMLGLREHPSKEYLEAWGMTARVVKRAKAKVPVVVSRGLDDDSLVAEILLLRAQGLSREPAKETVVLLGDGAADDAANERLAAVLGSLAGKMMVRSRFAGVESALLRPDSATKKDQARKSAEALRARLSALSRKSRVLVVPHLLARDGSERALKKKLDNLFVRYKGEALLPDKRLASWIESRAKEAAGGEDMVKFKDEGRALPAEKKQRFIQ